MKLLAAKLGLFLLVIVLSIGSCDRLKGPKGDKGDKGDPGTSCSVVQLSNGMQTNCTDGTSATVYGYQCNATRVSDGVELDCNGTTLKIQDGTPGLQGPAGPQGIQGIPGSAGTTVTFVKFCTQYADHYPTSFPEYGLCVGGSIFGVYWDGTGAFGSKILQGYYQTTNTQLPCNFTVGPNCTVY